MVSTFKAIAQGIPNFSNVYHDTVTEQHKQFYFYNKLHNVSKAGEQNRKNFSFLNEANLKLGRFCKKIVASLQEAHPDDPRIAELAVKIKAWQDYYNDGGTFDTFEYAKYILEHLDEFGYPVFEQLAKADDVLNAFVNIPYVTKSFFQINIVVREEWLPEYLMQNFEQGTKAQSLHYYVKELTINRSLLVVPHGDEKIKFAILKYILLPGIVNTVQNPVVNKLVTTLTKVNSEPITIPATLHSFSDRKANNIFVSQGSTNYKKFLTLLRIIDKVYREEENYAYIKL
jgi:hypothetical protein